MQRGKLYITSFYICLFVILGLFCSCNAVFSKLYGVKKIEKFDAVQYLKTLDKLVSKYDSTLCISHIGTEIEFKEYYSLDEDDKKNLYQPIQILYFYDDTLKSFHANCYAKGTLSGKLNWNYNKQFSTYYPTSAVVPLMERNTVKLSSLQAIYKIENTEKYKDRTTIVFFWTNMLKKQSIIAFDTVVKNIMQNVKNKEEYPLIILINNDHAFTGFT